MIEDGRAGPDDRGWGRPTRRCSRRPPPDRFLGVRSSLGRRPLLSFIVRCFGAPEAELEPHEASDKSLFYPVDPRQLPKELAGSEWPPK
jgi:hypothetical protein